MKKYNLKLRLWVIFFSFVALKFGFIPLGFAANSPIGYFDGISSDGVAGGWVLDPDRPGQSTDVHFYIDGPAGSSGIFVGSVTANRPRPDVNEYFKNNDHPEYTGNYGFAFYIPYEFKDNKEHQLYAYGIDMTGDQNLCLPGSPMLFTFVPDDSNPQYIVIDAWNPGGDNPEVIISPFDNKPYVTSNSNPVWISEMINTIGTKGTPARRLAFGEVIYLWNTDESEIRACLQNFFSISEDLDVPIFLHLEEERFWEYRPDLWNWFDTTKSGYNPDNKYNVEWSNWDEPVDFSYINWGSVIRLKPKSCFESQVVRDELNRKYTIVAEEVNNWRIRLAQLGQDYLFAGIHAGWETGIDSYKNVTWQPFPLEHKVSLGYNALSQRGFSKYNPPADIDTELEKVVKDFAEFEVKGLFDNSIPKDKLYTHIWGAEGIQSGGLHAPINVAVNDYSLVGLSLYPNFYNFSKVSQLVSPLGAWAIVETPPPINETDYKNLINLMRIGNCRLVDFAAWGANIKGNPAAISKIRQLLASPIQDNTEPTPFDVSDEGLTTTKTDQLYASWTDSTDPESGLAEYKYKITQDSITGTMIRDWPSTGTTPYVTAGGLNLQTGKTYYFSVKAINGAGLWSEASSDGITVVGNLPSLSPSTTQVSLFLTKDYSSPSGLTLATGFTISNTGSTVTGWQLYNNQD
ncbi:MAG: fibronectin type III domain-containing protein, partial [Candidatus Omnitrophota bacterium]